MIIEAEQVSYNYGEINALENISFEVKPGELLGVIGPNGSGKTTLVKNITGILKNNGSIYFNNRSSNLSELNRKTVARKIGVVPQMSQLKGDFTVREVIEMGRYPYQKKFKDNDNRGKEVVNKVINKLTLERFEDRFIEELSGGEFQKVLVARALAQEPEVLIFDEATSHLDINHSIDIFKLAKQLIKDEKITVIAIIHDLNLAAQFCDRLMVLNNGKKIAIDEPEKIITQNMLADIFNLEAIVQPNPVNKRPYIIPVV
ncbi:ABC transporter ATP-binding protein [Halanaerobiaceae bacterium Z-7014]|uniref:ABC transporter ATP-binding protein n=1 Tax=Halonatronomonas betaini TaxID=2778430 RepID=A0A931F721_9FIRM|nr:ABC transporter ATP-binding protein [Halonatronomonas betaini]MBF8436166.1 ABC transporter ATP-binding protein [Halonatronomonas betaini]